MVLALLTISLKVLQNLKEASNSISFWGFTFKIKGFLVQLQLHKIVNCNFPNPIIQLYIVVEEKEKNQEWTYCR